MPERTRQPGQPPEVFELAGHTVRWLLLNELSWSDRRVRELVSALGEPQPLVSYHLGKLRSAGVVVARQSAFDRRDSYYSLDLEHYGRLLADAGAALHPALRLMSPPPVPTRPAGRCPQVLFLCTGNSARSQIAEAWLNELSDGTVKAFSAGSRPKPLHANAIRVMRERGIDISGHRPKHLDTVVRRRFDQVISLCDRVREVCPEFPGDPQTTHWSIPDPAAEPGGDLDTYPAFQRVATELETRVRFLLHRIGDRPPESEASSASSKRADARG